MFKSCNERVFFENCIFAEDPSFVEIEKDAIQARLNIKTLSGKVDISGWDIQSGEEKKEEWASQRFFWMDGDRVRVDVIPSTGPTAGIRETECLNCDKMGWGILSVHRIEKMTKVFPLSDKNKKLLPYCIDFRVLGYCPAEIDLCNKSLDSIVGAFDREPPTIKQEQMNGDRCWRLQWKSKKNVIYDVWICPARGSNVVRIDTTAEYAKGPTIRKTLRSKVVRVGKSDSWFPEHVIYEIRNGDKAVFSETLSISNVHINEDVFPGTFTLAGFDLEAGTGVHRVGEKPAIGAWNPKTSKVEPLPDIPEPEFIDAKSSGSGSAHWRIALASFALVGSIGLIILSRWCYLPRKPRDTRQTLSNKGDAEHVRQS